MTSGSCTTRRETFSESRNLAAGEPQRLAELIALWRVEAERYDVLPLDDDTLKLYQNAVPAPRATHLFYPGMTRLDRLSAPDIFSFDSRLVAEVVLSEQPANGVILAAGDSSCGYELYMRDGYLTFVYVYTRNDVFTVRAERPAAAGAQTVGLGIRKTAESAGERNPDDRRRRCRQFGTETHVAYLRSQCRDTLR